MVRSWYRCLLASFLWLHLNAGGKACTSFCLIDEGCAVFGTNLDFSWGDGLVFVNRRNLAKSNWKTRQTDPIVHWTSQYGSLTFSLVGREFAWSGMNEAGLVISTMSLPGTMCPEADGRPPLEPGIWSQYLLDTCASVEEAVRTDDKVRIQNNRDHYLPCDATGQCAVIEFLRGRMVVHRGENVPVPALTNSEYPDSIAYWRKGVLAKWLFPRSRDNPDGSLHRFNQAAKQVDRFLLDRDGAAVDYAFQILENVSMKKTRWSIVYDIPKRIVHFKTQEAPGRRLIRLEYTDFSCRASMKVLDINTRLTGDVTDLFGQYNHQLNIDFMSSFCGRYGVEAPIETIEWLVHRFESYPCVP